MRFSRPWLALSVALAVMMVAALAASAARACESANASASTVSKRVMVRATLCVLNAERARQGLRPLKLNRKLSKAARRHSRAMASRHFFSHTSPDGSTFVDRIRGTGYLSGASSWSIGENIAYGSGGQGTPRAIGSAWMTSPGHRANILSSSFSSIGIGIVARTPFGGNGATYTTDFGRRR